MKTSIPHIEKLMAAAVAALLLVACSSTPTSPIGADNARAKLAQLQSDPQLANQAPVEMKEAETAVHDAEQPREDKELAHHLVLIADRKVDIAQTRAQTHRLEEQRKALSEQRDSARLDSRTREADRARSDANYARNDANAARADASNARNQADAARMDTEAARMQSEELQRQIAELNAKQTDRGLVVTLGDVLFATGKSDLKSDATSHLAKLAAFLNHYPNRSVIIEGYTDSTGSDDYNMGLSQRRSDSVKSFLQSQGISAMRLVSSGKGESSPIADNDSASGRQQNRRVEVIVANTEISSR